jgi:hypothetical protein
MVFLVSWFTDTKIALYEINNNGFLYNLGFSIGISCWSIFKRIFIKIRGVDY